MKTKQMMKTLTLMAVLSPMGLAGLSPEALAQERHKEVLLNPAVQDATFVNLNDPYSDLNLKSSSIKIDGDIKDKKDEEEAKDEIVLEETEEDKDEIVFEETEEDKDEIVLEETEEDKDEIVLEETEQDRDVAADNESNFEETFAKLTEKETSLKEQAKNFKGEKLLKLKKLKEKANAHNEKVDSALVQVKEAREDFSDSLSEEE